MIPDEIEVRHFSGPRRAFVCLWNRRWRLSHVSKPERCAGVNIATALAMHSPNPGVVTTTTNDD
jgi:hypothetical protein